MTAPQSTTTNPAVEENVNPNGENADSTENSAGNAEETKPTLNPGLINAEFYTGLYDGTVEKAKEHNGLLEQVKAAGDRVAITDMLKEKPESVNDDAFLAIAKRRQELSDQYEAAEKEFAAAAEPHIDAHLKRSHVPEKLEKADELAKQVKATIQFLNSMNATTDGIPTLTNRSGKTSTGTGDGRGAGVAKYRNLEIFVNGKRAEQKITVTAKDGSTSHEMRSNLTYGANAAGVDSETFRKLFTDAQGTTDAAQFKDVVEFDVKNDKGVVSKVLVRKMAAA